jgi:hypothetical protein
MSFSSLNLFWHPDAYCMTYNCYQFYTSTIPFTWRWCSGCEVFQRNPAKCLCETNLVIMAIWFVYHWHIYILLLIHMNPGIPGYYCTHDTGYCIFPTTSYWLMKNFALQFIRHLRAFPLFSVLCAGMQNAIIPREFTIWSHLNRLLPFSYHLVLAEIEIVKCDGFLVDSYGAVFVHEEHRGFWQSWLLFKVR